MSRRVTTIVVSDISRFFMNVVIVGALVLGEVLPWHMMLAVLGCFGNGLAAGFFRPSHASLWADLTEGRDRQKALATNSLLSRSGLAVGAAVGGLGLAFSLAAWVLLMDAATFLLTAMLVIVVPEPKRSIEESHRERSLLGSLNVPRLWLDMMQIIGASTWLKRWFVCNVFGACVAQIGSVALPVHVAEHWDGSWQGAYYAVPVVLLVVGGIIARLIPLRRFSGFLDVWGRAGRSIAFVIVALGISPLWATMAKATASLTESMSAPSMATFIAEQFPAHERGRVFGAQMGVNSVLGPVGMLAAGPLLVFFSSQTVLVTVGLIGLVLVCIPLLDKGYWSMSVGRQQVSPS